ncbi:hypothetical protein BJX68DRAFT_276007 [Aspergillus pseudodeflectus]|uniref:NAD(P)-binding protein n=1 Tax=Aspergillus pseudodeflectus TaxID=176178 RepID=A0ABR4KAG7_9EURO
MSDSTIVLITGVARGLGKALTEFYLARPNHTVIGTVRDPAAPNAQALLSSAHTSAAPGSKLHLLKLEATHAPDYASLPSSIKALEIPHLDLVIANSGISCSPTPLATISPEDVLHGYDVNTVGTLRLWQATRDLLEKSARGPKWVSMSSGAGSIEGVKTYGTQWFSMYGMSKAGMNWLTVAIHNSEEWVTAFAVHPGLVQTDMGNKGAREFGMEEAPNTIEEAITKTTAKIDEATREATSGRFWNVIDGTEFPW